MTVLDVRPVGYALAARTAGGEIAGDIVMIAENLGYDLAGCYGMAGTDDVGSQWGASYTVAAANAQSATRDAANAMFCVAALLEQTGINYAGAEAACIPWETAAQSAARWAASSAPEPAPLPSAVGAGLPEPSGWSLLQHAIGRVWPNGHQDLLRNAAQAWRSAAHTLEAIAPDLDRAIDEVAAQRAPEVDDAVAVMRSAQGRCLALGGRYRELAAACDEYAHRLDEAHSAILHECVEFIDITVAAEAAGGLLSVVTVGLSEVAANSAVVAAAYRIGRTIADLIDALAAAVIPMAAELDAAAAGFATVERELAPILARRVEQAEVVRPGIAGTLGPVTVGSPTDVVLTRFSQFAAKPQQVLKDVENPKLFDPHSLKGMDLDELKSRVPADWRVRPSRSGGGHVFEDPRNYGRHIRVMPGYPRDTRADLITQGPYVVVRQNGDRFKVALAGNPTLK
jgi:hypothetical protein